MEIQQVEEKLFRIVGASSQIESIYRECLEEAPVIEENIYLAETMFQGRRAIVCYRNIGRELEERSSYFFQTGNSMKGYLLSTAGDLLLFSMEEKLMEKVTEMARQKGQYLEERIDPYEKEFLQFIYERLSLEKHGVHITNSGMFDPEKSLGTIFLLGEEEREGATLLHDCRNCERKKCIYGGRTHG